MAAVAKTFWWTKPDGSYGKVRASSAAEARKKKKGAKIHTKPPYSWMEDEPARRTSRTRKKAAPKKTPKRKTSRKAPPKKTSRGVARRKPPAKRKTSRKAPSKKKAPPKKAPRRPSHPDLRSETHTEEKAIADAHKLLAKWKVPGYEVVFSEKRTYRKTMGTCNMRDRVITFSRLLWDRATPEQRKEVVIHEVAHAVVRDDYGYGVRPHGREWKDQMRKMGIRNPKATHTVPTHGLSGRRDVVAVVCGNCGAQDITVKKLMRLRAAPKKGKSLWTGINCRGRCAGPLNFLSEGDKKRYMRLATAHSERRAVRPNTITVKACGGCCG